MLTKEDMIIRLNSIQDPWLAMARDDMLANDVSIATVHSAVQTLFNGECVYVASMVSHDWMVAIPIPKKD